MIRFRAITGLIVMSLAFVGLAGCDLLKSEEPVGKAPSVFRLGALKKDFSLHPYAVWASYINSAVYTEGIQGEILNEKNSFIDIRDEWAAFFDTVEEIDENTIIVTLRDDVYFHNGDTLTPEDIAFSFNYAHDPQFATRHYPHARVEILKNRKMKLTKAGTLGWNWAVGGGIVSKKYELAHPNPTAGGYTPMGTGPYQLVSYDEDEKEGVVKLKRFENYFEKTKPFYDEVEIHLYENSKAMAVAFLEGRIDISTSLTADDIHIIENKPGFVIDYIAVPCAYQYYPLFRGPGEMREIRKAFSLLVDREELIRSRAIAPFASAAIDFPFRIKLRHWPEGFRAVGADQKMFDRDEAYRLLAKAGWRLVGNRLLNKEGKPLRLRAYISRDADESHQVGFRQVISQWADAGILLEDSYLYDERKESFPPAPGDDVMEVLFATRCLQDSLGLAKDLVCVEKYSYRSYCDIPEVGRMMERIESQPDNEVKLQPLYAQMLIDQALLNYLYYPKIPIALNSDIPELGREAIMKQPYTLHYLFRGSAESRED